MENTVGNMQRKMMAFELADLLACQRLIIDYNVYLLANVNTPELRESVRELAEEDNKNMRLLETALMQYGVKSEPKYLTSRMLDLCHEVLSQPKYSLLEKVGQYGVLKALQMSGGNLCQRCIQQADPDIREALAPLAPIHHVNSTQAKTVKYLHEAVGLQQILGKAPEQGFLAGMKDLASGIGGAMANLVAKPAENMSILSVLKAEHTKVDTLFSEIELTSLAEKKLEYFDQLYSDLITHAVAEQKSFYEPLSRLEELSNVIHHFISDHADIKEQLSALQNLDPSTSDFRVQIAQLQRLVTRHVDEEENVVFPQVKERMSESRLQEMAADFKREKLIALEDIEISLQRNSRDSEVDSTKQSSQFGPVKSDPQSKYLT
jgi:hemerythrin superfamily protein